MKPTDSSACANSAERRIKTADANRPDVVFPARVRDLMDLLRNAGATRTLLVGGWVRDHLLGIPSSEHDLEVYGLSYDAIVATLTPSYRVDLVGESFGVVKVDGTTDLSIPRRERKIGIGHREFEIAPDPTMTPEEAAGRRDFTINAMAFDDEGTLIDPFGGEQDLAKGLLRATSDRFREDPLRVLRGMQFAARFNFQMDDVTEQLCRDVVDEFDSLAPERIMGEWWKWATKSRRPSAGIRVLRRTGWLEKFPELKKMDGVPQDDVWHPEGDVLTHTEFVVDAATEIAVREQLADRDRALLLFASLLHDIGKPDTTAQSDAGRWISPGHAGEGARQSVEFLERMRAPGWLAEGVERLVKEHMVHLPGGSEPTARAVRRLSARLHPAKMAMWAHVCEADHSGRPPLPKANPVQPWLKAARELAVLEARPGPILTGRLLLAHQVVEPGPAMGELLDAGYEAQLDGVFETEEAALVWAKDRLAEDGADGDSGAGH